jgi:hypothetical protein
MSFFRHEHDWFPNIEPSEFLPLVDICLSGRCTARRVSLPYGQCLGGHPIAEHYGVDGSLVPHPVCPGPA